MRLFGLFVFFTMVLSRVPLWAQQTSFLVMYGFGDRTSFPEGDVWPDAETWKQHWEQVFSRFTVITGRTEDAGLVQRLRSEGILFAYHVVNTVNAPTQESREQRTSALVKEWSKP